MNRLMLCVAVLLPVALTAAPASAAIMACIGDNMAKTSAALPTMQDGPAKMAMAKEIGMANTEMSKGNMRVGCIHYMKAQKMGMMKTSM